MQGFEKVLSSMGERNQELYRHIRGRKNTAVFGMQWADRTIAASRLDRFIYICSDYVTARETYRQISTLRPDAVYLPAKDDVLTYIRSRSLDTVFTRLAALHNIATGKAGAVVTSVEAVMQLFPGRKEFLDNCLTLKKGGEYSTEILSECLVRAGYRREAQVTDSGQFAQRGDIFDISPINLEGGVRLEFFGDELESIKAIDFSTQVSGTHLDEIEIAPGSEYFCNVKSDAVIAAIRADIPKNLESDARHRIDSIISEIEFKLGEGYTDTTMSFILPYAGGGSLWDFAGSGYTVVLDEIKRLGTKIIYGEHCNRFKQLLSKGEVLISSLHQLFEHPFDLPVFGNLNTAAAQTGKELNPPPSGSKTKINGGSLLNGIIKKTATQNNIEENALPSNCETINNGNPDGYVPLSKRLNLLGFYNNPTAGDIFMPEKTMHFDSMPLPVYCKDFDSLISDISIWSNKGMKIYLFAGSADTRERLAERLRENRIYFGYGYEGNICLLDEELYKGAVLFDYNVILIGTYDLIAKKSKKTVKRSRKDVFSQPRIGEYVVHEVHGIGVCESIEKLSSGGASRDYLVIRYRDGDKLFVPVENMDSLTKYNSGEETPKLSKIGGAEFAKAKDKARQSVKKMAFDLLKLYAERSMEKGHVYEPHDKEMEEFGAEFPFVETDDQMQAIGEGLNDLAAGKIMDRLLCGDVGYGKTEVALRLAYNVILGGKQVAFVSPTTILARQHFNTVKERMEKFGVHCVSLTRLNTDAEITNALVEIKNGKADIVCGTHRVLSKDVQFKDLGFLILDEEQRFGVADKEKIKLLKKNVGVLSLSATPIPRTLHMSMSGIRDISILDTPPMERIPIQTYVTEYTDTLLTDAVSRELNRGGQVFIVYNKVANIDVFAAKVRGLVEAEVGVIHGQMQEKQMEDTLSRFISGEVEILIASTIIENGIDMPKANTMIVIDSDRLGLSQLYQLRGRVGRSNRLAYVFFTYDESKILTENAYKRLDSINEFTEFGSGFKIAMRDLQIRGAGNIMGREQHGHMEKVGYDMYLKILSEELDMLKGTEVRSRSEVKVNIDFDAFIPEKYIPDTEWRLKVYSRISHIDKLDEITRLEAELNDIYGPVPPSVIGLCKVAMIKNLASTVSAASVTYKKTENAINYAKVVDIPPIVINKINAKYPCTLLLTPVPAVSFGKGEKGEQHMLSFLL